MTKNKVIIVGNSKPVIPDINIIKIIKDTCADAILVEDLPKEEVLIFKSLPIIEMPFIQKRGKRKRHKSYFGKKYDPKN